MYLHTYGSQSLCLIIKVDSKELCETESVELYAHIYYRKMQ
jgi:hypothetical protein